jgi:hypothetical protein
LRVVAVAVTSTLLPEVVEAALVDLEPERD